MQKPHTPLSLLSGRGRIFPLFSLFFWIICLYILKRRPDDSAKCPNPISLFSPEEKRAVTGLGTANRETGFARMIDAESRGYRHSAGILPGGRASPLSG